MSIEGGYAAKRDHGVKPFTEYESNALMALVAQFGVGIVSISNLFSAVFIIPFLSVFTIVYPDANVSLILLNVVVIALISLLGIFQSYYGWRLHQQVATTETCIRINTLSIVLSVIGLVTLGFNAVTFPIALLFGGYLLIAVIVVDVIAIALLRSDSSKREFRSSSRSDMVDYSG